MAGPNARVALMAFPTYRTLAPGHKDAWLAHLERLGPAMTECLKDGEVFASEEDCRLRLDSWGFKEGCRYIVKRNRSKEDPPSWQYACMYHGKKGTQNNWELEDRVSRVNGTIVSKRKRNTTNRRLGCPVQYALSYRLIDQEDKTGPRHFVGRWMNKGHEGHPEFADPFDILFFRDQTVAYCQLKSSALTY